MHSVSLEIRAPGEEVAAAGNYLIMVVVLGHSLTVGSLLFRRDGHYLMTWV